MVCMRQIDVAIASDSLQFLPCTKFNGDIEQYMAFADKALMGLVVSEIVKLKRMMNLMMYYAVA